MIGDETIFNLQRTQVFVFSDSVLCMEGSINIRNPTKLGRKGLNGSRLIQASQSSVKVIAARSKAKAKPQKREIVELPSTIPMNERKWIDIEPAESSLSLRTRSRRKSVNLLRHFQTILREDDGAFQFWRIEFHLRNQFPRNQYWSDDRWKACLAAGRGSKRRYQYRSDFAGTIVYLRDLQGHSGRSLIDPSLQDNVILQCGLFHHIYHIGCAF